MSFRPDEPVTAPEQPGRRSLFSAGASGAAWLGGSQVVGQTLHVAIRLVLARLLAPEAFGLLAAAVAFTSAAQLLLDLGFGAAIIQRRELQDEHSATAFWAILGAAALATGLLVVAAPLAGVFYRNSSVTPVLQVLSLGLLLGAPQSYYSSLLSRELRFNVIGLRKVIGTLAAGAVGLAGAFAGWGVWALVAYSLVQATVGSVLLGLSAGEWPGLRFSTTAFAELWRFSRSIVGSRMLNYFNRNADNLIIGRYLGAVSLGLYGLSYQAVLLPLQYVARPLAAVAFSMFSSIQTDKKRCREAYLKSLTLIIFCTWPVAFVAALAAAPLVPLVLGAKWIECVPLIQLLAITAALQTGMSLSSPVFQALGRPDLGLKWTAIALVANLTAFIVGLRWEVVGVAAAYLIANAVTLPIHFGLVIRLLDLRTHEVAKVLGRGAVASTILAAAWLLSSRAFPSGEVVLTTVGSACAAAVAYMAYSMVAWRQPVTLVRRAISDLRG